jgi:hypothetical protein
MHHIPSVHAPFPVWAAVLGAAAAVILAAFAGRLLRRHLARLAACLAIGAAAAFGVTAWADGQRRAALTAAARAGHAPSVTFTLAAAFIVITVAVASVALTVSALAARLQGRRSLAQYKQYGLYTQSYERPGARRGRSSAGRGW